MEATASPALESVGSSESSDVFLSNVDDLEFDTTSSVDPALFESLVDRSKAHEKTLATHATVLEAHNAELSALGAANAKTKVEKAKPRAARKPEDTKFNIAEFL